MTPVWFLIAKLLLIKVRVELRAALESQVVHCVSMQLSLFTQHVCRILRWALIGAWQP
jgi:hypothetical protein